LAVASSLLSSRRVTANAPAGPVFVAGSSQALGCLRRALARRCHWFVSHLPVEGEGCVELLARSRVPGVWLSPWAVAHAAFVTARLRGACFVVVEDEPGSSSVPEGARWLQVSPRALAADPSGEVERLISFVERVCAEAA
jgi:hypothetical protein